MNAITDGTDGQIANKPCLNIKFRDVKIGNEMLELLKSGNISDDRLDEKELQWTRKLQSLDEAHTKKSNLKYSEAGQIMNRVEKYAKGGTPAACPDLKQRLMSCLEKNSTNSLKCNEEVVAFATCVDDMLYRTSRKEYQEQLESSKKLTYTEKFQQLLQQ